MDKRGYYEQDYYCKYEVVKDCDFPLEILLKKIPVMSIDEFDVANYDGAYLYRVIREKDKLIRKLEEQVSMYSKRAVDNHSCPNCGYFTLGSGQQQQKFPGSQAAQYNHGYGSCGSNPYSGTGGGGGGYTVNNKLGDQLNSCKSDPGKL